MRPARITPEGPEEIPAFPRDISLDDGRKVPRTVFDAWSDAELARIGLCRLPDPEPPAPTPEQIQAEYSAAIQARLDAFAQTRLYDGILSLCTYATSTDPAFSSEGQRGVQLRDATWRAAWTILGEAQAGIRPVPTIDELFALLPALTWPDEQGAP